MRQALQVKSWLGRGAVEAGTSIRWNGVSREEEGGSWAENAQEPCRSHHSIYKVLVVGKARVTQHQIVVIRRYQALWT